MEEKRLWLDCVVVACFWCPEINVLKLLYCSCKIVVLNLANGKDMHCSVVARHTQQRAVAVEVHAVDGRGLKNITPFVVKLFGATLATCEPRRSSVMMLPDAVSNTLTRVPLVLAVATFVPCVKRTN